jgi:arylsulfatase A-like enzyme
MPARASLITGKYVCNHGVWNNVAVADPRTSPSFVRNIKNAGYHTAVIGKTHLWSHDSPTNTNEKKGILKDWGFEYVHELTGPRASIWVDSPHTDYLRKNGVLEDYRRYQAAHYLHNHTFNAYGDDDIPDKDRNLMATYGISRPADATEAWVEPPWPLPTVYHNESYVGARTVEWIKTYDGSRPFFLMVGFPSLSCNSRIKYRI